MLALYSFYWDCRRMGDVDGLFVAEVAEVEASIGKKVYFGEILGKHSEICGTLDRKDLTVKSDDQDFIAKLLAVFDGRRTISGYNPLSYIDEENDSEE